MFGLNDNDCCYKPPADAVTGAAGRPGQPESFFIIYTEIIDVEN